MKKSIEWVKKQKSTPCGISYYEEPIDFDQYLINQSSKTDFEIIQNPSPPQVYLSLSHDCPSKLVVDDYYQYFVVIAYQSSYYIRLSQLLVLSGFSYLLHSSSCFLAIDHLILYTFGLDNLVNLLTYVNQTYFPNVICFYREWWTLKYLLLILSSPIGYCLYLTCPPIISKIFWICMNLPFIINFLANLTIVRKYYYNIFQYIYTIIRVLLCQKIAKIINRTSEKYLFQNPRLSACELIKLIPIKATFSELNTTYLIGFSSSSIFAFILFYLELDGTKFYTAIARQFYFGEYFNLSKIIKKTHNRVEHRQYILDLIVNREWHKFSDIYTLNRLLKLYLEINSEQNGGLFFSNSNYSSILFQSCNRLLATIALSSVLPQYPSAIIFFYLVDSTANLRKEINKRIPIKYNLSPTQYKQKKIRPYLVYFIQLIIISIHCGLNYLSSEFMLRMIVLESTYVLMGNPIFLKLCVDIIRICHMHFKCLI